MWGELAHGLGAAGNAASAFIVGAVATFLIHSTLLIGVAALLTTPRRAPVRSRAARELVWRSALVGSLVTTLLQLTLGIQPIGGAWQAPFGSRVSERVVVIAQAAPGARGPATGGAAPRTMVFSSRRDAVRWVEWTGLALLLASGAGLLALMLRRRRLDTLLQARVPADGTTAAVLREVQRRAGDRRRVILTVSTRLTTPAALGHDEICLPARMLAECDPLAQETILAHELAHLERRDTFWLSLSTTAVLLLPFQPLLRVVRKELQALAEFAADDWAARVTRNPLLLARTLGRVAEWLSPNSVVPAAATLHHRGSPLVQRVRRLTEPPAADDRSLSLWAVVPAAAALAAVTVAAPRIGGGTPHVMRYEAEVVTTRGDTTEASVMAEQGKPALILIRSGPRGTTRQAAFRM